MHFRAHDQVFFKIIDSLEDYQRFRLAEFFRKEAPERNVDMALFGTFLSRQDIASEEAAERAADVLLRFGDMGLAGQTEKIYLYLLENFPLVLIRELDKLKKFDPTFGKSESAILVTILIDFLPTLARHLANKKLAGTEKPRRSRKFFGSSGNEGESRAEELVKLAGEEQKNLEKKFFSLASRKQKEMILKRAGEYRTLTILFNHLEEFLDCDRELLKKALKAGVHVTSEIGREAIDVLKKSGLEDWMIDNLIEVKKFSTFESWFASGLIELLSEQNIRKIIKFLENEPTAYASFILIKPGLLSRYKIKPPREMLAQLLARTDDELLQGAIRFIRYAESSESLNLGDEYRLEREEVIREIRSVVDKNPQDVVRNIELLGQLYSADEIKKILKNYLSLSDADLRTVFFDWEKFYKDIIINDGELRHILKQRLLQDARLVFDSWREARELFDSEEERMSFVTEHLEETLESYDLPWIEDFKQNEPALQKLIKLVAARKVEFLPDIIAQLDISIVKKVVPLELVKSLETAVGENPDIILDHVFAWARIPHAAIDTAYVKTKIIENFRRWCARDPERVWAYRSAFITLLGERVFKLEVLKNKFLLGRQILADLNLFDDLGIGSGRKNTWEEEGKRFIEELAKELVLYNPTWLFSDEGLPVDAVYRLKIENPRGFLLAQIEASSFAKFYSKKLRNLYAASERKTQGNISQEFLEIASKICRLEKSASRDIFLFTAENLPKREQERFLARAEVIVILGREKEFLEKYGCLKDASEINRALSREILGQLNGFFGISATDSDSELLLRPVALIIFASKQRENGEIMNLLRELVENELMGRYKEWRYFANMPKEAGFVELKRRLLLPGTLTFKQYEEWVRDESVERAMELSFDVADINVENEKITRDAILFGHVKDDAREIILDIDLAAARLEMLESPLRGFQLRFGELQSILKENKRRKKQGLPEIPIDMDEYEALKEQITRFFAENQKELDFARANLYLAKILRIGADEAASGKLNVFGKRNGEIPFHKVFEFLREVYADHPEFINDLGKIQAKLEHAGEAGMVTRSKFTITDETNLLMAMEIGAKPVSSCQHYERGGYNESLPAYAADPNTKIFTVRGERGQLIARAIARLLEDEGGAPVLYVEGVYSADPSPEIKKAIMDFAVLKAGKMGVPISFAEAEGMNIARKTNLKNNGSRNVSVYADSGGGLKRGGKFIIKGAAIVEVN